MTTTARSTMSRFSRSAWLTVAALALFAASFALYVWTEQRIDEANELRYQSYQLTEELRRSSDELTRAVRSYIATGEPAYRRHYHEVLATRDGRPGALAAERHAYWDLPVAAASAPPAAAAAAAPAALLERMRRAGFSALEFSLLSEAKHNSDSLTHTELAAMTLFEGANANADTGGAGDPGAAARRQAANAQLYSADYRRAKAAIMRPIGQVQNSVEQRTLEAVHNAAGNARSMRAAVLLAGALLLYLVWRSKRDLDAILGCRADLLHQRIERLSGGDFASTVPVPAGRQHSVLGWLAEMQQSLRRIDAERGEALARHQRVSRLYNALSQCNQAIVRSTSEAELFERICRAVVQHGGMKMAWIGMIGADGHVVAAAMHGDGTDYLNGLHLPLDEAHPHSRGPIGRAYRSGQPYWCQDFQADPATAVWHARGAQYGWGASAALPLRRDGRIVGFFSLYSATPQAFDQEARELLLEMVLDIEFALKNFDREARREQADALLRKSERHLRTIIETEPECIKVLDSQGRLLEMNAAGLAILEADSLEQLQCHNLVDLVLPAYRADFIALHQRVIQGGSGTLEFEVCGLRGGKHWMETHAAPMAGGPGEPAMLLGITRDITARKRADAQIQYLAHFDALTGLSNRTQLQDHAEYALSLARQGRQTAAVMLLDLDHFKDINDSLGHSAGDTLLVELAGRLRQTLRPGDLLARLGGDEFMFVLPGVDAAAAALAARHLLGLIEAPCHIASHDLNVTASIGIALYPADGADLATLFQCADAAMYRVKREGRNDLRFFTAEMQQRSARNLQLVSALRQALERGQMQVHYQPQFSQQGGRIVGAEALLRWHSPELGQVSPAEFIPAAEDSGLILPIGAWVLRQAARQARLWIDAGLAPLVMAVNLSAVQFRQADLPRLVTQILDEEGLPAEYLELELTEGVAMHDPQGAIAMMNSLHERGVRMSIDDFGTGYSSLSHLKKFKVYKLKIDQSFVRDICTDPEDKAIVGAIIQMARSLGLLTIAEGVETAGQLEFLREQGCDEMQGYYFSKPLPAAQFEQFARARQ
ncbi:putative bifunctional diguanylate cyclase/phosphodiesterase [Rugamonas sp. CCM 8940]|uniref:putative bifunctional diguanylate cyclase/phosphodiesterase n=1 Tax=Rugamonas sp. CCM 8940 TaxID=2765359 RepID=UPI0018F27EA5|nr:EAL domain-containing protein [Rugamonas sp. CCM 8940]MBJ7314086.1 EAL domain-containing protein [Rugamonas sp. CCM 8940]